MSINHNLNTEGFVQLDENSKAGDISKFLSVSYNSAIAGEVVSQ